MPKFLSLKGMPDITPEDAPLFRWVEDAARKVLGGYEFLEIRTPILEETGVFVRSIGGDTDIVEKEMYSFRDRGGKSVSMRPEGTAGTVRSCVEHGWLAAGPLPVKLFSIGQMFRGERPQKGRLRQFHQIGAEIIGTNDPCADAELLLSLKKILEETGVTGYRILLNSLGCARDRASYKKILSSFLKKRKKEFCDNCRRRMGSNVLRVLDCKEEKCGAALKDAPSVGDHICPSCASSYASLKKILAAEGVEFTEKKDLVRGLDYYTGAVFEVTHPSLGSQNAVAAGGRYDGLVKEMGGPDVGATGYAIGVERLVFALDRSLVPAKAAGVLVIPADETSKIFAVKQAEKLRSASIAASVDTSGRSLKGGMRRANREKRKFVVIVGENEVKSGTVALKNMETGEQKTLTIENAIREIMVGSGLPVATTRDLTP